MQRQITVMPMSKSFTSLNPVNSKLIKPTQTRLTSALLQSRHS